METCHTEKFSITDPTPQSLGLCFSNVDGNGTLASAIMKKMAAMSWKLVILQNFQLLTPKSLCVCFSEC